MESIKLFTGLFVIGLALYLCVELVPPYYSNYEFQSAIKNEALLSANNMKSEDDIREAVYKRRTSLIFP